MLKLSVTNAQIIYDGAVEAVRDVSFSAESGKIVCLLGANGAGKTTLLKSISGILGPEKGLLTSGSMRLGDVDLSKLKSDEIVRRGVVHVPEARRLFINLTLEENLAVGGYVLSATERKARMEVVYELLPDLKTHRKKIAGYLSGGQQQMVAIGRAMMSNPSILMLDEPSLGLAPKIVSQVFSIVTRLREEQGIGIILVEQNARLALEVSDYGYVLERGRIVFDGAADELLKSSEIQEFYLGMGGGAERKSMRDVKHYKRRKRWLT